MCGLVFSFNVNLDLDICNKFLYNRGPDANGHYVDDKFEAYHTRLKIFDLSDDSNQPYTDDGVNYLLFNGSIYNFKQLIDKYDLKHTSSDTVVVYDLLKKFGKSILSEFNGMFAIVFFNILNNDVFIIRDRFGVKPLYYFKNESSFIVSSSAKLISKHLNLNINNDYLTFGLVNGFYDEVNSSPYIDVFPVKPGSIITFNGDNLHFSSFYVIPNNVKTNINTNKLRSLIEDAVKIRLSADRTVGVSQSGGVDSSIISYVASSNITQRIKAFCFGGRDSKSEYVNAKRHSDRCNLDFNNIDLKCINTPFMDLLHEVINAQEAPFLGTSIIAQYLVFARAKQQNVTVMLGGQGADELFCGYKKYLYFNRFSPISLFNIIWEMLFNGYNLKSIKNKFLKRKDSNLSFQYDFTSINNLSIQDLTMSSLPTLLRYEDRNSMASSIETRLPFLDYRLVDYVNSCDKRKFVRFGFTKFYLRKIFNGDISFRIIWNFFKRGFDTSDYFENYSNLYIVNEYILSNKNLLPDFLYKNIKAKGQLLDWPVILTCLWYINESKEY